MGIGRSSTWKLVCSEEEANGYPVLVLSGRLGFASVPMLEDALGRCGANRQALIVDISGVDYISSAALNVLEDRARARGGLVIVGACDAVRLTLEFSGLTSKLILAASRADALTLLVPDKPKVPPQ